MNRVDLLELKERFPLPTLLEHLGLGNHAKASCKSPLRHEHNASWGIYEDRGLWRWKDLGTGDGGDEIDFLARYLRLDGRRHFPMLANLYESLALEYRPTAQPATAVAPQPRTPPDRSGFGPASPDQTKQLSELRHISVAALEWAQSRGVLVFGKFGGFDCYGTTDSSGKVLEVRRLDGENFPAFGELGERKSHAVKGSQKSWPVGIKESLPSKSIALVEGLPDLLAAHDLILREQAPDKAALVLSCAPVGMLAASVRIADEALPFFANKLTVIYPHADEAGLTAAGRWHQQIQSVGGQVVLFDTSAIKGLTSGKVKDLNDFLIHNDAELLRQNPSLNSIMPR